MLIINKTSNAKQWNELFRNRDTQYIHYGGEAGIPIDNIYIDGSHAILKDLSRPRVGIIGTRDPSQYGQDTTRGIVSALASNPLKPFIVSGLAFGINGYAHRYALETGLPTIAVMPTGPGEVYPLRHESLADEIRKAPKSCLLTQFPEGTVKENRNFVRHNATIATICDLVIVVESRENSSAMITARMAQLKGIPVLAVPGQIDSTRSAGCNHLIKTGTARILTNLDILSDKERINKL